MAVISTTTQVTITQLPFGTLTYAGNPFCSDQGTALPTLSSTWSGLFDSNDLTINTTTGAIDLATSNDGTHDAEYIIPAAAGCPEVTLTYPISITTAFLRSRNSSITSVLFRFSITDLTIPLAGVCVIEPCGHLFFLT